MGLVEAAVFAGRLHGGCGFHRLAKGLHRHTRRRRDMIVRGRRNIVQLLFGILTGVADHWPESLSLAFSASGYRVVVGVPLRYCSKAAVRRVVRARASDRRCTRSDGLSTTAAMFRWQAQRKW